MSRLADVLATYEGSNGDATKALYEQLGAIGAAGTVAVNLFRAQKSSARAKVYRGGQRGRGSYRGMAYDRKEWAIANLCGVLAEHGDRLGLRWGWGVDDLQPVHRHVLYVNLPTGQVSFHAGARGSGPHYEGEWDGVRDASPGRIIQWVANLLESA